MERILRLPDNQVIKNQRRIDNLLVDRRSVLDKRKVTPPPEVLKNIDLDLAELSKEERNPVASIELSHGKSEPLINDLFEIPDIYIDLTPQAGTSPRDIVNYKLVAGDAVITLEVYYNSQQKDYWQSYGNQGELDKIVSKNLLEALHKENWQCDWKGAWSVKGF